MRGEKDRFPKRFSSLAKMKRASVVHTGSVKEALIEMYLAGVFVRREEDTTN